MRAPVFLPLISLSLMAGCAPQKWTPPSLAPRAAEAIDPRVPVVRPVNDRPVTASLAERLGSLVSQAQAGNSAFDNAAAEAERLAAAAGAPQSDGWIVAQEALTAAIAARQPTAQALGDIDALAASALQDQGGIAPSDLAAIQRAQSAVDALDARQSARLDAVQKQLGS